MSTTAFNRDAMAAWYARQHLNTDPGIVQVWYLPTNAEERVIRLLEINDLIADRDDNVLEAVDFGVDRYSENEHQLLVLDVTPSQWGRINNHHLSLPRGWTLKEAQPFVKIND